MISSSSATLNRLSLLGVLRFGYGFSVGRVIGALCEGRMLYEVTVREVIPVRGDFPLFSIQTPEAMQFD